jgi:hypothetical protein
MDLHQLATPNGAITQDGSAIGATLAWIAVKVWWCSGSSAPQAAEIVHVIMTDGS